MFSKAPFFYLQMHKNNIYSFNIVKYYNKKWFSILTYFKI